ALLLSLSPYLYVFNDPATSSTYTLSLHDALPISCKPSFTIDHPGKFSHREPMHHRNGMHAYKRSERRVEYRTVDVGIRIWPVKHDNLFAVFSTRFHNVVQRADVCIKSRADILDVKYSNVDISQLLGCWLAVVSVERHDGQSKLAVDTVFDMFARIGCPTKSMFRCEDLYEIDTPGFQGICKVHVTC